MENKKHIVCDKCGRTSNYFYVLGYNLGERLRITLCDGCYMWALSIIRQRMKDTMIKAVLGKQ